MKLNVKKFNLVAPHALQQQKMALEQKRLGTTDISQFIFLTPRGHCRYLIKQFKQSVNKTGLKTNKNEVRSFILLGLLNNDVTGWLFGMLRM